MDNKLNIVIGLLLVITVLLAVNTFSNKIEGQSSSAKINQDDLTGSPSGISGGN